MRDYRSYIPPPHRNDVRTSETMLRLLEEGSVIAGIGLDDQDPIKSEITLMGTIAYCKYCPEWILVPLVPNPGWASHCCDVILHRYVTSERQGHTEWLERMKRARRR
jgi:hypothetical protein